MPMTNSFKIGAFDDASTRHHKEGRKEARAARDTAETKYRSFEEKYDALEEKAAEYKYKLKEAGIYIDEDDDEKNDDE